MLGKRDPQISLFGAASQLGARVVAKMGFYGQLARHAHTIFPDENFAQAYCPDNGRPSVPPSLLAIARLLQIYEKISDREAVQRAKYDLRWKVALGQDAFSIEAPFAKSTVQAFRARLTLHLQDGLVFEKSVKAAKEAGLLPDSLRVALDSSPVRGRGAIKDTFNLLSDAIVAVVRSIARTKGKKSEEVAQAAGVERHLEAPSIKGSEVVEWNDKQSVSQFLDGLLEDCDRTVKLIKEAGCASDEATLLRKIVAQDVDRGDEQEGPKIRQGVAKDRTVSVTDPEMRHGRKSSGKTFNGHKVHTAVAVGSGVITAIEVTAPSTSDGSQVGELVRQTTETTGCDVYVGLGDCAYSTREALRQAAEANVEMITKMPAGKKGQYGAGDFEVSEDRQSARCPGGHASAKQGKRSEKGLEFIEHVWSPEHCGRCPLRKACTQAKSRSLRVHADFHDRRGREQFARTAEGRAALRSRTVVEHSLGRLKNVGAGTARYFGRLKTEVQWQWSAALVNLHLVWAQEAASRV